MTLKDNLYKIISRNDDEGVTTFRIQLNPECFIYKAHFPGNPITPGVCIVQTARELLQEITGERLEISAAKDIKFQNILSPTGGKEVDFVFTQTEISGEEIKTKADVSDDKSTFTSISFSCVKN